jgi:hypothetical protein
MDPLEAIDEAVTLCGGWLEDARAKDDAAMVRWWSRRIDGLKAAAAELAALRASAGPLDPNAGDLNDLPSALLEQLSGRRADPLEDQILQTVRAAGPAGVGLDRLLIELYRRHGEVHERKSLNNKTYRMAGKGLIEQVGGQRGVYRAPASE